MADKIHFVIEWTDKTTLKKTGLVHENSSGQHFMTYESGNNYEIYAVRNSREWNLLPDKILLFEAETKAEQKFIVETIKNRCSELTSIKKQIRAAKKMGVSESRISLFITDSKEKEWLDLDELVQEFRKDHATNERK